jgi:transposase
MTIVLEDVCIGHINPSKDNCKYCSIDDNNKNCPSYKSRLEAIKEMRPEYKIK